MNLDTLKLYCDVIRLKSFSRGAQSNQITQSAASQAISQLEDSLGLQLIDRSKRPFALTTEGQIYYEGTRALLSEYEKLESEIRRHKTGVAGVVRVAAIYSVGLYDLSSNVRRFMSQYPQAKVRLEYLRPNKVHDAVVNEEADIGIMSYPRADRSVTVLPWRSEKMVLVCHPTHRLATRQIVSAIDLEGENFIAFDPDLPIRKAIDRSLKRAHSQVTIVMEFDNIETMKQGVEINAGVSILPEPTVRREADGKRMVAIPLSITELVRPVGIIHRRNKPLTTAVQRFIHLLKQSEPKGNSPASLTPPVQAQSLVVKEHLKNAQDAQF